MNNSEVELLLASLKGCIEKNKGSSIERVLKSPLKLPWSKLIEKACQASHKNMTLRATTFWGEEMNVVFPEIVSCFLYRYGYFEADLSTIIMMYVKPGQTFFDVGTHFGYYSMLASKLVGPNGQVHSFEPTAETYKVVQSNVSSKSNVTLNNLAGWSEEKVIKFKDYGTEYSAFNSLYGAKLEDSVIGNVKVKEYDVQTISIDKYISNTGARPDFIKIDAENAEFDILKGMEATLRNIRPAISIEVGDVNEGEFKNSSASVNLLLDHKYRPFEFRDGRLHEHTPLQKYKYSNILFLPQ
jgi:FkbM family methyltransferase